MTTVLSERALAGLVLNIDKPAGITSFRVVQIVRRIVKIKKVGHSGTLDPMATGVLIVCTGKATKQITGLMATDKTYTGTLQLGLETDSYDKDGHVTAQRDVAEFDVADIRNTMQQFEGTITQVAPAYSALKVGGVPMYKLARQGKEVPRKSREVTISELRLEQYRHPFIDFSVTCSKGTYVRSIAHDIGEQLECGACLTALRRTRNGQFSVTDSIPLDSLADYLTEPTSA
jgi:tRNA pseudouridine55 synthase